MRTTWVLRFPPPLTTGYSRLSCNKAEKVKKKLKFQTPFYTCLAWFSPAYHCYSRQREAEAYVPAVPAPDPDSAGEAGAVYVHIIVIPGKEKLKRTSLLCLRLIQIVLEKQEQFMYMVRESGSSAFVSPMDKLLMGINPRSGKPDHLVNIAK